MMHFRRQHTHCLNDGREDSCSVGADRIMGGERISWWEKAVSVYCPRNSPVNVKEPEVGTSDILA
jgi:hypothetical protein